MMLLKVDKRVILCIERNDINCIEMKIFYRIIESALGDNQIYCVDSKEGNGSTDSYETDVERVFGENHCILATVHCTHDTIDGKDNRECDVKFKIRVDYVY